MQRSMLFGAVIAMGLAAATPSHAISIELGLAIDGSGSISSSNFALQKNAYISVLQDSSLVPRDGSIAIGVVQFSSSAQTEYGVTVITDATIAGLVAALSGMTQLGGGTNIGAAIDLLTADITGNAIVSDRQVIDVSTDGFGTLGTSTSDALAAGIEQINCLGIGAGANCGFASGTGSFSVTVADFADFESALRTKIGRETGQVPEPGTLAVFGAALAGFGFLRRRA